MCIMKKGDINMKNLKGTSLVGGNGGERERVDKDYYATPYITTEALLNEVKFTGNFLEPCVGAGHIAKTINKYYPDEPIFAVDIVDRGYPNTLVADFLSHDFLGQTFDNVITNPPFNKAQEFLEKSMELVNDGGKVALFLKIQFLEGNKRREMFTKYPPKYIYVFSKRQVVWRNGEETDENGKPWSNTMCFAWFIWEKGSTTEPIIRWL